MKYTIFSIDDHKDWHNMARFMRYVDELMAMGKTKGKFIQCVGSWEGKLEPSFICRTDDFNKFILKSGYVDNQEAVMRVSECNKQYADFLWLQTGNAYFAGSLRDVSQKEALEHEGWTYRPDLNRYWVLVQGNPDRIM